MRNILLFITIILFSINVKAQEEFEFFVIDSYVTFEKPHVFHLMFLTTSEAKTKVIIDNNYEFEISDSLTTEHNFELDLSKYKFDSLFIPFYLIAIDAEGKEYKSEKNEFELPELIEVPVNSESNIFTTVCLGSVIFLTPSVGVEFHDGDKYFNISKELPIISFYGTGYNYPAGYVSVEYSYTPKANDKNRLRLGYKHIFRVSGIEYISPGATVYSNLMGNNGFGIEINFGLFKFYESFTLYTRYRYNFIPGESSKDFSEINLGLYSNFFSFNF